MTHPTLADPFGALGVPRRFDLDPAAVHRAYLMRVGSLHPDLGGAGGGDAEEADRASAVLNQARDTLLDPERRAAALLALLGGPAASEDRSLPEGFLMEMMDVRERAEAECADPEGHARWSAWAAQRRADSIGEIGGLFAAAAERPGEETLAAIRRALNAWRYVERMIEQLDPSGSLGASGGSE